MAETYTADRPEGDPATTDKDYLEEAREAFDRAVEAESDNRTTFIEDLRFARLSEQWPEDIRKLREGRPCLTIPRMNAFIRQVVNDARQNKPSIKVHPVDSAADVDTADIISGLIRNIEYTSKAGVSYDTATETAVSGGWGYFRIGLDYAHDDTFDLDINISRVSNPLLIYGDPYSTAADSSDWNSAFVIEMQPKDAFEAQYHDAEAVDWEGDYGDLPSPWVEDDAVMKAEWWTREEVDRPIVKLSNGTIVDADWLAEAEPDIGIPRIQLFQAQGVTVVGERTAKTWKVMQCILTGAEVLEKNDWPGRYIPIVPVYGDEVTVDGKRYFRSLTHDAQDAQRMHNYWRSTSTELVALAPKVPFIGAVGSFKTDASKWATANRISHAYLQYDGNVSPQRQPLDSGPAIGAMQEALAASDDMKAIMGLYDASLGAKSNETSGRAILARQREGDVSTFHFIDNLSRAIDHAGRIIIDLIPHVYSAERVIRVVGEDGSQKAVPLGKPVEVTDKEGKPELDEQGQAIMRIYDLSAGKYDLTVTAGPSFTTRREEAATQMMEMIRAVPAAAERIGDILAKNLDWPGADEIAERLKPPDQDGIPPQVQEIMDKGKELIGELQGELKSLKDDRTLEAAKVKIDGYNAETKRLELLAPLMTPEMILMLAVQTAQQVGNSPDVLPGPNGAGAPPQGAPGMGGPMPPMPGPQGPPAPPSLAQGPPPMPNGGMPPGMPPPAA